MKKSLLTAAVALPLSAAQAATDLDEIVVTPTRTAQTVDESLTSVTVISREDIERSQPATVTELLRSQAGIHISHNGGIGKTSSVFLRGTNADHVLVLIDGVRASSATLGEFSWSNFSPAQIERIEIVYGPRASLYGSDAIGGVIHIFTRTPRGASARFTLGSDETKAGQVAFGGGETWRYSITAGGLNTGGIPVVKNDDADVGYDNRNLTLALDGALSSRTDLKLSATQAEGTNELDPETGNIDYRNRVLSARLRHDTAERWHQTLTLGHALDESRSFSPFMPATITTNRLSASWQHDVALGHGLLSAGIDHWQDEAEKDDSGIIDETLRNTGLFLQHQFGLAGGDINLAIRQDEHSEFGSETTWSAAWGMDVTDRTRISASHGTAFKAPTVNDLFWPHGSSEFFGTTYITEGNPDLRPESSRTTEVILRQQLSDSSHLAATAYYTEVENLIDWQSTQTGADEYTFRPDNVSEASIRGLTLQAGTRLAGWSVNGSFDYLDALDEARDEQLDRRPKRTLKISANRIVGRHDLGIEGLAFSDRLDNNGATELDAYQLVNLQYRYRLGKDFMLGARVENLLDEDYVLAKSFSGEFNTLDRSIYVSLSYQAR